MLTTPGFTISELNDTTVRYAVEGPGGAPALLLINSLGTDHRMWSRQERAFTERYRVIRYDARGQGGTAAPDPPYAIEDLGADAVALLDHLGIERTHVCGVSLGGFVALWLAINRPDRLHTAVYADTAARIGTADGWNERISAVRDGGMVSIRDLVMERFFSDRFRDEEPEVVADIGDALEGHRPEGYIGHCTALRDGDLRDDVGAIGVPSLVIVGTADVSTPPEESRWLHERIAGCRLEELSGAGHLSNLERPTAFTGAVLDHLDRHLDGNAT